MRVRFFLSVFLYIFLQYIGEEPKKIHIEDMK